MEGAPTTPWVGGRPVPGAVSPAGAGRRTLGVTATSRAHPRVTLGPRWAHTGLHTWPRKTGKAPPRVAPQPSVSSAGCRMPGAGRPPGPRLSSLGVPGHSSLRATYPCCGEASGDNRRSAESTAKKAPAAPGPRKPALAHRGDSRFSAPRMLSQQSWGGPPARGRCGVWDPGAGTRAPCNQQTMPCR